MNLFDRAVRYLEHAAWLDRAADLVDGAIRAALGQQPAPDVLSGRGVGHQIHPLLVAVPIGAWTGVTTLDARQPSPRDAAVILTGLRCAVAVPPR